MGVVSPTMKIEMALGGSFRQKAYNATPISWWRMSERSGTSARDTMLVTHGTITGDITKGVLNGNPEGGGGFTFGGSTSEIALGDPTTLEPGATAFSLYVSKLKCASVAAQRVIYAKFNNANRGYGISFEQTTGKLRFFAFTSGGTTLWDFVTSAGYADGNEYDCAFTWDGTTGANKVKIWVNGTNVQSATAAAGTIGGTSPNAYIGRLDEAGTPLRFIGSMDDLIYYAKELSSTEITALRNSSLWTDISSDLDAHSAKLNLKWGISANGPKDRMADLGILTFNLKNHAGNSASTQGYYSPSHLSHRSGFNYGVLTRVVFTYSGTDYQRFIGKIAAIDPIPGRYASQLVRIRVHDLMDDLLENDLRNVKLQTNQNEDVLQRTALEALIPTTQPLGLNLDTGLDLSPFAFAELGAGDRVYNPLFDLIMSSIGFGHMGPDGVYRYENRNARQLVATSFTFNDDMVGLVVPTTLDGVFNHVRATYHPKTIDALATTVLFAQTGDPPVISPGQTIIVWGDYYKTSEPSVKIGGTAQVTPVSGTDWTANTLADDSGTNKTAQVTVTTGSVANPTGDCFASTTKFTITNNDAGAVFLTKLQIRGKGLYDFSPITVESISVQSYGERDIDIDLKYQNNYNVAKGIADYIRFQFELLGNQAFSLTFQANYQDAHMLAALSGQIGQKIVVTETVTGLIAAALFIQSVQLEVAEPVWITCTLGLAATSFFSEVWQMGIASHGEVGDHTYFGFV